MLDLYQMIESGGRMKFEVTGEDLVMFADRLIEKAQQMKMAELEHKTNFKETYLTPEEVAGMCGISPSTLYPWEKAGYLIPNHVGKRRLYKLSDVERILSGERGDIKTAKKSYIVARRMRLRLPVRAGHESVPMQTIICQ